MINVLIADDSAVQAEQLSNVLSKEKDFKILKISKNGMEAYTDYLTLKPTALVLDLDMPVMSGIEVINELSNDTNFDSKKNIIVVSGSMPFRSQISNPNKIKWIFSKPLDYDRLIEEIREIKRNEGLKPSLEQDLDKMFTGLDIKPYTKGSRYLKTAINIAYYDVERDINISNIIRHISFSYKNSHLDSIQSAMDKTVSTIYYKKVKDIKLKKAFSADYKITTKDFINRALYYIDNT